MITLRNVTLRRGAKVVLEGANVVLNPGEKAGLVGRNGAGKSSLFSLMAGRLHADAGDFEMPPTWRLGEVAQAMPETEQPATDFVLDGDIPLVEARDALAAAESGNDGHAIAEAHVKLEEAGAFDARARAQALLLGLGFKLQQLDAPVNSFSGGWRMRLQLARALMCPADLLLLDEPTNHLDLDALVWLEGWLQRFKGTLLVISHDREFLDAITGVTLHLEDAKLDRYGGNYSAFEGMRAERLSQQASAYERQQDKIAQLQRFIDRFKAKATKAKQAQSRVKALDRMEKLAPVLTASDFSFQFREPVSLPNPMLSLRAMECGYPQEDGGSVTIVRNVNRTVLAGQRIGILGANGQGKSTLVKTVARELSPIAGTMTEGKGLSIGYFAQQEMDLLHGEDTPLSHMIRLAKVVSPQAREQELRDFLGQFRFGGEMAAQPIGTLSGGEKARLVLASLVWQKPNLLLLDEPTNHLDLTTREALSMALNEFEGTVMLVSHDRALLREVCDEFWLVSRGGVEPFDGDLDDYQRWLLDQAKEAARALKDAASAEAAAIAAASPDGAPVNRKEERKAAAAQRQKLNEMAKPLKNELKKVETRLSTATTERDNALAALGAADLSPQQRADAGRQLKALEDEIEELEMRWLELGEQLEQLAG
ncbi:ABC-F family ATP-binding cassette domain-containing protein [Azohydromonas lata]|uniref:ATP-binding cassette domain-containing protein n=1 Tax=Azohydromonas lata TaxID=45677 RepID=A0ABU5IKD5_9BURK|nr:ATP-binding cassette domain-containing protein [Azohydromonas lata]MDZ5459365.1 ATP-binding cassette domain-containing protein [Azohydromonas lata]